MARKNLDAWVPEETGSELIARIEQVSGIESLAHRVVMSSDTYATPRIGAAAVSIIPKGSAYPEDSSVEDEVILKTRKFGEAFRIAEEDMDDVLVDVVEGYRREWGNAYARMLDNACLGVTAAENGTTVPFTSVYRVLSTSAAVSATNVVKSAGPVTYAKLSQVLGAVETGDFFSEADTVIIAHPSFRGVLRGLVDNTGAPIFVNSTAGAGTPSTLFGLNVVWSLGARTSAVATPNPTGNPLLVVANASNLMLGVRSGPESIFIDGRDGLAALTDESILKMRSRRAFAVGNESAISILEVTAA